jgi:PKD repeat protein
MRIYIIALTLLLVLAALAGCQGKTGTGNRTVAPVISEVPRTPAMITSEKTTTGTPLETTPAPTPSPMPTSPGPALLSLGDIYRYGPAGTTIEASVYRYRYLDRYSWWDPNWGKFFPEIPKDDDSRFLFIFISMENKGTRAQWIPSPDAISVYSPDGTNLTRRSYWNASYYNEFENKTFRHEYPWVRELGVNDRDYEYIREFGYLGMQGGGFLWPGQSNAFQGYLVYEAPRNLTPGNTTVSIWFNNLSWASWSLQPAGRTEDHSLYPDFSVSLTAGPWPLPVQFTDMTLGSPDSWSWDFGDNETSMEENPFHIYQEQGSYTVTQLVKNRYGTNKTVRKDAIVVSGEQPGIANHSVSFRTARGGFITNGSYLNFNIIDLPGEIRLNGTTHTLPGLSNIGLFFGGKGEGEIHIRNQRFENLSFGDLTLYVNGSAIDRGTADGILVPVCANLSTALTYYLPPSRGMVSLTWDDRVVLRDEDFSAFTLEGLNVDDTGSLSVSVRSNRTSIEGNASAYRMPDLTIGGA